MKKNIYGKIKKGGKILKVTAFLVFMLPGVSVAHPHVFLETSFEFIFNDSELEGVQLTWVFDSMFSATVISDCDRNKNHHIDESEVELIRELYFSNLKNYNYLCHISCGDRERKVNDIKNFTAHIQKGKIVYSFFVPLNIELKNEYEVLKFTVYDDTYYIAVEVPAAESVRVSGISGKKFEYEIIRGQRKIIYSEQKKPGQIVMKFRK